MTKTEVNGKLIKIHGLNTNIDALIDWLENFADLFIDDELPREAFDAVNDALSAAEAAKVNVEEIHYHLAKAKGAL